MIVPQSTQSVIITVTPRQVYRCNEVGMTFVLFSYDHPVLSCLCAFWHFHPFTIYLIAFLHLLETEVCTVGGNLIIVIMLYTILLLSVIAIHTLVYARR